MASSNGLANIEAFLKTLYTSNKIQEQVYTEFPLLGAIPKFGGGSGEFEVTPAIIGAPQGMARTRATAQTIAGGVNGSKIKGIKWICNWGDLAQSLTITDKEIAASSGSASFFQQLEKRYAMAVQEANRWLAYAVIADRGRALASGTISAGVITLAVAMDATKFEIGSAIQASANDGTSSGHSLLGSGSIGYVTAVDPVSGTITVSASASSTTAGTPSGWTGTMYFFFAETFGAGGTTNEIIGGGGLLSWIPATAPTAGDSFNGVDRSVAPYRLAGLNVPSGYLTGKSMADKFRTAAMYANTVGTSPGLTHFYCNPEDWLSLAIELENRGIYDLSMSGGADITFNVKALSITTSTGNVPVIADRTVPKGTVLGLTMPKDGSNIYIKSLKDSSIMKLMGADGQRLLRHATEDSYEMRWVGYSTLVVSAPGYCVRFAV